MSDSSPFSLPKEPGRWRAIMLAAGMHLLLLGMLWIGVRWQSKTPVAVEAEVWSVQPQQAAPRPQPQPQPQPEPKPVVKEPPKPEVKPAPKVDIALEREKQKLQEQKKRQEEEAKEKEKKLAQQAEDKKKAQEKIDKAKQQKLAEQKEAEERHKKEMERIASQAGSGGSGQAPQSQGGRADADYVARLVAKIRSNTTFIEPPNMQGNPSVEYRVDLLPDGSIRGIKKLRASGLSNFDERVEQGVQASAPFPPDKSGKVPTYFIFSHKPRNE